MKNIKKIIFITTIMIMFLVGCGTIEESNSQNKDFLKLINVQYIRGTSI